MSNPIVVVGNLAADPELKFTKDGKAVVKFTVMTSRSRKTESGEWESLDVTGWRCTAWERIAEHVAESLRKGSPVVVLGKAAWREWAKDDGSRGGAMEVTADTVAVDLKRAPVSIADTSGDGRAKAKSATTVDPWAVERKSATSEEFPF